MNRWSKKEVLYKIFMGLQKERKERVKLEGLSIDSTTVKVHPNATGALKKHKTKY